MLYFQDSTGAIYLDLTRGKALGIAVVPLLVTLLFYVLRSVGLFTLAKRKGLKKVWLSWIPCGWIYIACMLVGETRVFGISFKKAALWLAIIFAVGEALSLVYNFIKWFPYVAYFLSPTGNPEITIKNTTAGTFIIPGNDFNNFFPNVETLGFGIMNTFSSVCGVIVSIATIFLFINIFRKYYPQHYIIASVFSFLGLFGPFVFSIRNRKETKYSDYIRARYGNMYGPYSNPYNGNPNDPRYGDPRYGQNYREERPPETPFKDFAERGEVDPGDPFSEFSDDKDKKDK